MLVDPHPRQQHASIQHEVVRLQQEVLSKAGIRTTLPEKSRVDGGAIRCQNKGHFTGTPHGDLVELLSPSIITLVVTKPRSLVPRDEGSYWTKC